jgi:tRNA threonylcarbamoyladenosine modification (KEOPS) complex Cgi121 subunit
MNLENRIQKVGNILTTVIGASDLDKEYACGFIEDIRKTSKGGFYIQAVLADAAYGVDHILQALKISIESQSRKILLASTLEMDLLLRISCTNQISIALRQIGLRNQASGCFIIFSKNKKKLLKIARLLCKMDFKIDDHVLEPSKSKKELICKRLQVQLNEFLSDEVVFTSFLSERAALLTK